MRPLTALLLVLVVLVPLLFGCGGEKAAAPAQPAGQPALTDPVDLVYVATNRLGGQPSDEAREVLVPVLEQRLVRIGQPGARVRFAGPARLVVTVERAARERADAEVRRNARFELRPRVGPEIENFEAGKRRALGDGYTPSRPAMLWVPFRGSDQDLLVIVAERPYVQQLERLAEDAAANEEKMAEVEHTLLQTIRREVFEGGDVAYAEALHGPEGSSVAITLRPERHGEFRRFTEHYREHPLVFILDGQAIAAPPLLEPIPDGRLAVVPPGGGFSPPDAEQLAEILRRAAYGTQLEPLGE